MDGGHQQVMNRRRELNSISCLTVYRSCSEQGVVSFKLFGRGILRCYYYKLLNKTRLVRSRYTLEAP